MCSGLTNKQLGALRASDCLEWTCQECHDNSPKRRSLAAPDDVDDDDCQQDVSQPLIDVKQLLKDISKEVQKAIKTEIKDLTQALEYQSDKMEEVTESLDALKETISSLQKKNIELSNTNTYLTTRIGALEQRVQTLEQDRLTKYLEISNVPYIEMEEVDKIADQIATKLKQPTSDIENAIRLPAKKDRVGLIRVELKKDSLQTKWLTAAKSTKVTAADVIENAPTTTVIYVREALTPYNKDLFWKTKQELKSSFQFIWCKGGVIRARKTGDSKIVVIRSEEDIKNLVK